MSSLLFPPLPFSANPKVQVYSSGPGAYGESNTLICHVSGFHPPDIQIQLLRNSVELPNANQTDLAFNKGWHFHLTRHAAFTPARGEDYVCKVTHGTSVKNYAWGEFGLRPPSCLLRVRMQ